MIILDGKCVAEEIIGKIEGKIKILANRGIKPHIAVLGINGDNASKVYIKKIEKNCNNFGIEFTLKMANTSEEFKKNFDEVKNDKNITGVMLQQPLDKELSELINELPPEKDVEGVSINNIGKLFLRKR